MEGWRGGCREGCRDRRKDARRDGRIYAQLWVRGGSPTEDTRSSPHNGVTAHSPAPLPAPAPCWSRKRKKNKSFHSPPPPPLQNLSNYTTTAGKAAGLAVGPESITAPPHPHRHPNVRHPAPRRPRSPALQPGGALEGWVRLHAGMPGAAPEGDAGLGSG